jgi:hypothetical protein
MMSRGYDYLLLLDWAGPVEGSVEHSEGKGVESVVAILRFLCGSSRSCRLRTAPFWPWWQALSCVLTTCQALWGPISRVAFVTTMSSRTSLLRVVLLLLEGEWGRGPRLHPESRGADFDVVGTCEWLSYVRASGSQAYGVLVRFFPCRVYINLSCRNTLGYEWQLVIAVMS